MLAYHLRRNRKPLIVIQQKLLPSLLTYSRSSLRLFKAQETDLFQINLMLMLIVNK